jgi:hypothetical protein
MMRPACRIALACAALTPSVAAVPAGAHLPAAAALPDSLRISEIHHAPAETALEFVELVNAGSAAIPLAGLTLADARDAPSPVPDPGGPLPPGGRLVLVRDAAAFAIRWPGIPHLQVAPWPALNNSGDEVIVRIGGTVADRVAYLGAWGASGRSLERRDPSGPSDHPVNWGASTDPSGATPGRENSIHAPDRTPPAVLLADRPASDIVAVLFSEPVDVDDAAFWMDGRDLPLLLVAEDRTEVLVRTRPVDPDGTLAVAGARDLFGNRLDRAETDVAHLSHPGSLRISEILSRPDPGRPGHSPFIEVVSASERPQSLRGLLLQGAPDAYGIRPQAAVPLHRRPLAPGERAVLFDAGSRADADSVFRAAFPSAASSALLAVPGWPFGSDPPEVRLAAADGSRVDSVAPRLAWHDPALGPSTVRSLERVDPLSGGSGPEAWTTSIHPSGATPGAANAAEALLRGRPPRAGDLRIGEILYEPAAGAVPLQPEFVEIESASPDAIDPNGTYLVNEAVGSVPDSVRIGFAPDALSRADFIVLVWIVSGSGAEHVAGDLAAAFPASSGRLPAHRIRPAVGARSLRNDGATLVLRAADGTEIDRFEYAPSLHHPALRETAGISLERVDRDGPSGDPTNWTSTTHPEGATPGWRAGAPPRPPGPFRGVRAEPRVFTPSGDELARHVAIHVRLHEGPSVTDVRVFDLAGRAVRTLADGRLSNGPDVVYWNGLDDRGLPSPTGPYVVSVRSWAPDGRALGGRAVVVLARR